MINDSGIIGVRKDKVIVATKTGVTAAMSIYRLNIHREVKQTFTNGDSPRMSSFNSTNFSGYFQAANWLFFYYALQIFTQEAVKVGLIVDKLKYSVSLSTADTPRAVNWQFNPDWQLQYRAKHTHRIIQNKFEGLSKIYTVPTHYLYQVMIAVMMYRCKKQNWVSPTGWVGLPTRNWMIQNSESILKKVWNVEPGYDLVKEIDLFLI